MGNGNRWWRPIAAMAVLAGVAGCPSFDIVNRNAPERERAFSDPATVKSSAAGAIKNYINARVYYEPALAPFSTMADEHTFSWNNFQSRYYSSYGEECPMRCGWANETTHPRYEPLPFYWYGMYSVISSANDVLFAIRQSENPPDLGVDAGWVETIAQLAQGAAHAMVALTYDQGFVVTEESDPAALELVSRADIRDAAIQQLDQAATLAHGLQARGHRVTIVTAQPVDPRRLAAFGVVNRVVAPPTLEASRTAGTNSKKGTRS